MDAYIAADATGGFDASNSGGTQFHAVDDHDESPRGGGDDCDGCDEFNGYKYEGGALDVSDEDGDDAEFWSSYMSAGGEEPPASPHNAILVLGGMGWSDDEFDAAFVSGEDPQSSGIRCIEAPTEGEGENATEGEGENLTEGEDENSTEGEGENSTEGGIESFIAGAEEPHPSDNSSGDFVGGPISMADFIGGSANFTGGAISMADFLGGSESEDDDDFVDDFAGGGMAKIAQVHGALIGSKKWNKPRPTSLAERYS